MKRPRQQRSADEPADKRAANLARTISTTATNYSALADAIFRATDDLVVTLPEEMKPRSRPAAR